MNLHATYSKEAAIAEFGGGPQTQRLCDGQFATLSKVVAAFVTVGKSTDGSHLQSPSRVIWKPGRLDYAPADEYPWFPYPAREVFRRSGGKFVRIRSHHIFLQSTEAVEYVYAGEAHLGSYGSYGGPSGNAPGNREACFTLAQKLPRDIWLQCGGYSGWQIDFNHEDQVILQDDRAGFDRLLDELLKSGFSHLCMTRYEEDSLEIHTNPNRAWLMYLREPADCGLYLNDPSLGDHEEHFRCGCGISLDFPASQTASRSQAVEIARHLFKNGKLPDSVGWFEM